MNWYKKSSHNLRLPSIVKSQVDTIVDKIVNFYENFNNIPTSPVFIGDINFRDIYSQINISESIYRKV